LIDKDRSESDEQLIRGILQYVVDHPDAKDTLEGIYKWWLPDSYRSGKLEILTALNVLASKGWLTKRGTIPSKEIYGINRDRLQEIKSFLLQPGAGS
jgi:hypothetical protein